MTCRSVLAVCAGLTALAITACETPAPPPQAGPAAPPPPPPGPAVLNFDHFPPGNVIDGTAVGPADTGYAGTLVVAPGMRFPMESGPAYANSQIFMFGPGPEISVDGTSYPRPGGSQSDPANYDYPWRDNFCEARSWTNGKCGAGKGHQGQDIRPATCRHDHWAVAPEEVIVNYITTKTVELISTDDGRAYRYLHLDRPLTTGISPGDVLTAGQRIGKVSNISGGTDMSPQRWTTIHLHFEIWDGTMAGFGSNGLGVLSPYTSLVEAYRRLGGLDPANHARITPTGNCTYPDGGLP